MLCCHYFAKNVPRFLEAKGHRHWDVFETEELRDKTLGLIGSVLSFTQLDVLPLTA